MSIADFFFGSKDKGSTVAEGALNPILQAAVDKARKQQIEGLSLYTEADAGTGWQGQAAERQRAANLGVDIGAAQGMSDLNLQQADLEAQRAGIRGEQQALRTGTQDARRGLQSIIAQRGLQNSSIGLGQQTGLMRDQARGIAQLGAQGGVIDARQAGLAQRRQDLTGLAGLQKQQIGAQQTESNYELMKKRATDRIAAANMALGVQGAIPDTVVTDQGGGRSGGLFGLAGPALSSAAGSYAGTKAAR